jgi:hypothetical protein
LNRLGLVRGLVDRVVLALQQHVQPPVAKPPPFLGQRFQPLARRAVIQPRAAVVHARPVTADHPAGPPLAHLEGLA